MFTGLIEDRGELVSVTKKGRTAKIKVKTSLPMAEIAIGDSVAVNGVCLTVESKGDGMISFHALAETLSRSNLGAQKRGALLNLERALCLGARLGGHIVTGHVDFCAEVLSAGRRGDDFELKVAIPADQRVFFAPKGSVAVNGVSLTVASLSEEAFTICLIPLTLSKTNLESLKAGSYVNIETDILGKYVAQSLNRTKSNDITMDTLLNAGF